MNINYRGRVVDEYGQPLMGANVISTTGRLRGVITDIDGYFQFNEPEGEFFQISFVGYKPQRFMVTGKTFATPVFRLIEDVTELQGYTGTPTKPSTPYIPPATQPTITAPILTSTAGLVPVTPVKKSFWDNLRDNPLAAAGFLLAGFFVGGLLLSKTAQASDKMEEKRLAKLK